MNIRKILCYGITTILLALAFFGCDDLFNGAGEHNFIISLGGPGARFAYPPEGEDLTQMSVHLELTKNGAVVGTFDFDADKDFSTRLEPGTYTLVLSLFYMDGDEKVPLAKTDDEDSNNTFTVTANRVTRKTVTVYSYYEYEYKEGDSTVIITKYNGPKGGHLSIPDIINGKPVVSIGAEAFKDKGLTSVTIPNSVTSIEYNAFRNNLLEDINIPDSVIYIKACAFQENKLTSVTIPDSVTEIWSWAFGGNELQEVEIGRGVTEIGAGAFAYNPLSNITVDQENTAFVVEDFFLKSRDRERGELILAYYGEVENGSIRIPDDVTEIGGWAFLAIHRTKDVYLLNKVDLNNVTKIRSNAFSSNPLGHEDGVTIPANVETIEQEAFYICWNLTSVTFEGELTTRGEKTTIGSKAFADCRVLTSVTFGVATTIESKAFADCPNLNKVIFDVAYTDTEIKSDDSFPFGANLREAYASGGKGTYNLSNGNWSKE